MCTLHIIASEMDARFDPQAMKGLAAASLLGLDATARSRMGLAPGPDRASAAGGEPLRPVGR